MKALLAAIALLFAVDASAAVSKWIPFDSEGGHIVIPATVNGIETQALLDTGATGNGISERFLEEHDLKYKRGRRIILSGIAGERRVSLINGLEVGIFGTNFELDQLMPLRLYSAGVLIGLGFFNNFILQIDYPNSRLRIITHDSLKLRKFANVRMLKSAGSPQPIVEVNLNNESDLWLTLDTGNNTGILIPRRNAARFDWLEKYQTLESELAGVTTETSVEKFSLPAMTIGPYTLENVTVIVPAPGERTNVGKGVRPELGTRLSKVSSDGILGYDVLKHFIVTIDYKNSHLHLEAPAG